MKTIAERFEEKTTPEPMSGCLLWTGAVMKNGYGRFGVKSGDVRQAHRYALELDGRPPAMNQVVMHLCNNRACVNPRHLRAGSQMENIQQASREKRMVGNTKGGESNGMSVLTHERAKEIRLLFKHGAKKSTLAKRYGVSWSCVDFVVRGITWRETT